MKFDDLTTDRAVLEELGRRIARRRLNRNQTQEALAREAGVSRPTLARLETGHSTSVTNLLHVLRALGLLKNLDALLPVAPSSPIQQAATKGSGRRRASSPAQETSRDWTWGDEG